MTQRRNGNQWCPSVCFHLSGEVEQLNAKIKLNRVSGKISFTLYRPPSISFTFILKRTFYDNLPTFVLPCVTFIDFLNDTILNYVLQKMFQKLLWLINLSYLYKFISINWWKIYISLFFRLLKSDFILIPVLMFPWTRIQCDVTRGNP